jgi:hypothetical protein
VVARVLSNQIIISSVVKASKNGASLSSKFITTKHGLPKVIHFSKSIELSLCYALFFFEATAQKLVQRDFSSLLSQSTSDKLFIQKLNIYSRFMQRRKSPAVGIDPKLQQKSNPRPKTVSRLSERK